jgi:hypothetical protein
MLIRMQIRILDFYLMQMGIRMRIQVTKMMRFHANPDIQHCSWRSKGFMYYCITTLVRWRRHCLFSVPSVRAEGTGEVYNRKGAALLPKLCRHIQGTCWDSLNLLLFVTISRYICTVKLNPFFTTPEHLSFLSKVFGIWSL